MICGIYQIKNLKNNKIYIGQSKDIKARFRGHKFSAMHPESKDFKMPIHLAMAKYGIDNFEYTVIEECPKELLDEREIYWIDKLRSYKNGYNASTGGGRREYLGRQVDCFDFNGNFVKSYPSVTDMAEDLHATREQAYQVLQGYRKSFQGYQIKYHDDLTPILPYDSNQGGGIKIAQIDKTTGLIINIFKSAAEASRKTGADSSTIIKVCKGKLRSTHGFFWRYY